MIRRKLIVNADDFGQSHGINKGIIKAHESGIVTSTSLMVRYPMATEAANYAKQNTRLGVGLHLDFGEWKCNGGDWRMSYSVVNFEDVEAVRKEVNEQLSSFCEIMGRKPTHIDSHQHAHLTPPPIRIVAASFASICILASIIADSKETAAFTYVKLYALHCKPKAI